MTVTFVYIYPSENLLLVVPIMRKNKSRDNELGRDEYTSAN
jgi:hypothetical protein